MQMPREAAAAVSWNKIDWRGGFCENEKREWLDGGDVLRIALLLQFAEKFFLLQAVAASEKFEQRIFQFIRHNALVGWFELGDICEQSFR